MIPRRTIREAQLFATVLIALSLPACGQKSVELGPEKQVGLAGIVAKYKKQYDEAGSNQVQRSVARTERGQQIMAFVDGGEKVDFVSWVCNVDNLSTETSGNIDGLEFGCGEFSIKLLGGIRKDDAVYVSIAKQAIGKNDKVAISGEFLVNKERGDWLSEASHTEFGSMLEPEFLTKKINVVRKEN